MRKFRLRLCSNLEMCLSFLQHSSSYGIPTPSFFAYSAHTVLARFDSKDLAQDQLDTLWKASEKVFSPLLPPTFVHLWFNSYQSLLFSEIGSLSFWPQFSMASVHRGLNQVGSIPHGLSPPGLSSPGLNSPGLSPPVTSHNRCLSYPRSVRGRTKDVLRIHTIQI